MDNNNKSENKAEQIKAKIKETWPKLSDSDRALYNGQREQFLGKLKQYYSLANENAEMKLKELEESCCSTTKAA